MPDQNTNGVSPVAVSGREASVTPYQANSQAGQVFNTPGASWGQYYGAQQAPNAPAANVNQRMGGMLGNQQIGTPMPADRSGFGQTLLSLLGAASPLAVGAGGPIISAVSNAAGGIANAFSSGGAGGNSNVSVPANQPVPFTAQEMQQLQGSIYPGTPMFLSPKGTTYSGSIDGRGFDYGASPQYGGLDYYQPFTPGFTGGIDGTSNYTPYGGGYGQQGDPGLYDPLQPTGGGVGYEPSWGWGAGMDTTDPYFGTPIIDSLGGENMWVHNGTRSYSWDDEPAGTIMPFDNSDL